MGTERKSIMISVRLPLTVVTRIDFVSRNTDGDDTRNRSRTIHTALEDWLRLQEAKLETAGVIPKKAR